VESAFIIIDECCESDGFATDARSFKLLELPRTSPSEVEIHPWRWEEEVGLMDGARESRRLPLTAVVNCFAKYLAERPDSRRVSSCCCSYRKGVVKVKLTFKV